MVEAKWDLDHQESNEFSFQDVVCDVCEKRCKGQKGLRIHKRKAHGEGQSDRMKCMSCRKTFLTKEQLSDHYKRTHSGLPPGHCGRCGALFDSVKALAIHDNSCKKKNTHPRNNRDRRTCSECNKTFKTLTRLQVHMNIEHQSFVCDKCGIGFTIFSDLQSHIKRSHAPALEKCVVCSKSFDSKKELRKHLQTHVVESWDMADASMPTNTPFQVYQNAHDRFARTYSADLRHMTDLSEFSSAMTGDLIDLLRAVYSSMKGPFKVFSSLYVSFTNLQDESQQKNGFLITDAIPIFSADGVPEDAGRLIKELVKQGISRATVDMEGSQWVLKTLDRFMVNVCKFSSFMGGRGIKDIRDQIPIRIRRKACLRIEESEDHCLFHCIFRSNVLRERSQEVISPETLSRYESFTPISAIGKIEKDFNIAINVYSYDDDANVPYVFPVRVSRFDDTAESEPFFSRNGVLENDRIVNLFFCMRSNTTGSKNSTDLLAVKERRRINSATFV